MFAEHYPAQVMEGARIKENGVGLLDLIRRQAATASRLGKADYLPSLNREGERSEVEGKFPPFVTLLPFPITPCPLFRNNPNPSSNTVNSNKTMNAHPLLQGLSS